MYLHLGQNVVVAKTDIIGIFDLDNTTSSHITRKYLSCAEKDGRIVNVSTEIPNSFVVVCCKENPKYRELKKYREEIINDESVNRSIVYISPLSSQTLLKRAGSVF